MLLKIMEKDNQPKNLTKPTNKQQQQSNPGVLKLSKLIG